MAKKKIYSCKSCREKLRRMAYEILENNIDEKRSFLQAYEKVEVWWQK
jgi:hypothetical protein